MSEPILKALELVGIQPSSTGIKVNIPGFRHLGTSEPKAGISTRSLSVWHAHPSHLPLTVQDVDRLVLNLDDNHSNLLISERIVPDAVKDTLSYNGIEVWNREKISLILGDEELRQESNVQPKAIVESGHPELIEGTVVPPEINLPRTLESIPIKGTTRPVLLEGKGWLASATLQSKDAEKMQSQAILIENPWSKEIYKLNQQRTHSFQIQKVSWDGDWTSSHEVIARIKETLDTRMLPKNPDAGKTSLLKWFKTIESTMRIETKEIWIPGWILTDGESGSEYIVDGISGSISKRE